MRFIDAQYNGPLSLADVTLSGNVVAAGVDHGGSLYNAYGVVSTIISGTDACHGTITSLGHNVENGDTCGLSEATDQENTDPLLGPLADNGGDVQTHELLSGSPAIDAGDNYDEWYIQLVEGRYSNANR